MAWSGPLSLENGLVWPFESRAASVESRDLNHAIALMSSHPGVKTGPFENRPADETINVLIAEHDAKSLSRKV